MIRKLLAIACAATLSAPAFADQDTAPDQETVIQYAGNGGLRDWQRVPGEPGKVFVRDRTLRWYKVTLTGPCERNQPLDLMAYTTDSTGTFDRFSNVRFPGPPATSCGVNSIVRTATPPQFDSKAKR